MKAVFAAQKSKDSLNLDTADTTDTYRPQVRFASQSRSRAIATATSSDRINCSVIPSVDNVASDNRIIPTTVTEAFQTTVEDLCRAFIEHSPNAAITSAMDLIYQLLAIEPSRRMSIATATSHGFLTSDWADQEGRSDQQRVIFCDYLI